MVVSSVAGWIHSAGDSLRSPYLRRMESGFKGERMEQEMAKRWPFKTINLSSLLTFPVFNLSRLIEGIFGRSAKITKERWD